MSSPEKSKNNKDIQDIKNTLKDVEFKSNNIHIHKPSILRKKTIFEKTRIESTMETLKKNGMSINTSNPPFIIKRTYPSGEVHYIKEKDLV